MSATPIFAAWQMAFCSAWTVLTQWLLVVPSSWIVCLYWWPISSQCGRPTGEPTYQVTKICLSLAMTQPLLPLSQVALLAIALQTSMKYWSRDGRMYFSSDIFWSNRVNYCWKHKQCVNFFKLKKEVCKYAGTSWIFNIHFFNAFHTFHWSGCWRQIFSVFLCFLLENIRIFSVPLPLISYLLMRKQSLWHIGRISADSQIL